MWFKSELGLKDGITIHIPKDLEVGLRINDSDSDLELQFEDLELLFNDFYTSLDFLEMVLSIQIIFVNIAKVLRKYAAKLSSS